MTKSVSLYLILSGLLATPALAAPEAPGSSQIIVRAGDLDLASATGQRLLERRLASAVIEVCGAASDADLAGSNAVRRCRVDTRAAIAADRDRLVQLASRPASIVIAAR